jgi:predicted secreted protein
MRARGQAVVDIDNPHESGVRPKVLPLTDDHVRGSHAEQDGPASRSVTVRIGTISRTLNVRRHAAAVRAAEAWGDAHRATGVSFGATAMLLDVSAEYVGRLAAPDAQKPISVRDVMASPASVCRAVGHALVAEATPLPRRSPEQQVLPLVDAAGRVQLAVARAVGGGQALDDAGRNTIERALVDLEDITSGLRALVRLARRGGR